MRLQDDDYLLIYPFAKPEEIREEFGDYSHCKASIRNRYRNMNLRPPRQSLASFKSKLLSQKPDDEYKWRWEKNVSLELENKKLEVFASVWERIRMREAIYREKSNA